MIHHRHHAGAGRSDQNAWVTFGESGWVSFGERRRLVLAWVGIVTYADTCFKAAAGRFDVWRFLIGFFCYGSTSVLAIVTFGQARWGWIIITWNCLSLGLNMLISVGMFHERFAVRRAIASVLVLAALFLAE
jgi:hypothetical protein